MSKRTSVKQFPCDEIQGEGSYVVVTAVKVREIRGIRKKAKDPEFDDFEGGIQLLARHIVKWNFVDDEGNPLPIPSEDPKVIDELTDEESQFLVGCIMGEPKNSEGGP